MKLNWVSVFCLPLFLSLCILSICYPGFMSYDSVRMLEEARSSVRGGIYPAAPVYILRFFDFFGHGPTLMLQTQNFVLLLSLTLILRMLGAGLKGMAISLLALIATPTVIGCMLVLWKDVTLAALMTLSVTLTFWVGRGKVNGFMFSAAKWSALIFLVIGTFVRFNAITSTAVIAAYWISVFYQKSEWKFKGAVFVGVLFAMAVGNKFVNSYSFPNLERLEPNPIAYVIMANDLIGISGWSRDSLLPVESRHSEGVEKVKVSDIDKIYSSLGALAMNDKNVALGNIVTVFPPKYENEDIVRAWLGAIQDYPMPYLRYRWDIFSEIIGAKFHATYEPTHYNKIDQNPFGIEFKERDVADFTLKYIRSLSKSVFGKPWFFFVISFVAAILVFRERRISSELRALSKYSLLAALLYVAPFFIMSGTGEVRYCFPAIVLSSIPIFVWWFGRPGFVRRSNEQ